MKRTQKTHVRKFGGVWYELTHAPDEDLLSDQRCIECDFIGRISLCEKSDDCCEGVIYWCGGIWKEIGEI